MKEMLGGCCVCSDDRGWTENPLVYCDGQGCTVAVHQACYGIVTVPSGPWFCRKCESQERAARVRCELCPSKDGALKRTDNQGWAHVVCALYIPEVRFGNVSTMEPIILSMVPTERFNKICYICESQGKESKAKAGACMNCNKSGCKYHFHVTCAQAMGLLCEEAGSYVDNVKYCGYCQHHYSKLKKGGNLKTIPAYKPLPAQGTLDSVQEKSNLHGNSNWGMHQSSSNLNGNKEKNRKKPGRKSSSGSQVSPKAGNARDSLNSSITIETTETEESKNKSDKPEASQFTNVLAGVGLMPGPKASVNEALNASSNTLAEVQDLNGMSKSQEHVLDTGKSPGSKKSEKLNDLAKIGVQIQSEVTATVSSDRVRAAKRKSSTRSVSPSSLGANDTESTLSNVSDFGHSAAVETAVPAEQKSGDRAAISESCSTMTQSVIVSSNSLHHTENVHLYNKNAATPQRSVSPLTITGIQSAGSNGNKLQIEQSRSAYSNICPVSEKDTGSPSASKKARRGRAPKLSTPLAPDSPPSSPDSGAGGEHTAKRRKKLPRNSATLQVDSNQSNYPAPSIQTEKNVEAEQPTFPVPSDHQKMRELSHPNVPAPDQHVASTSSETQTNHSLNVSVAPSDLSCALSSNSSGSQDASRLIKEPSRRYNGIVAPHMLGNQINPTSNVAQKMTDTLTAELEAHNISHESPSGSKPIVGVPFPPRSSSPSSKSYYAHSLEQLLERQWGQSSLFLMEQAQHFDIAALLSHLHSLQLENRKLEDRVATLTKRREHLLSVKARLSIPLSMNSVNLFPTSGNNLSDRSPQGPSTLPAHIPHSSLHDRDRGRVGSFLPPVENGIGVAEHLSPYLAAGFSNPHGQRNAKDSTGAHQNDRVIPSPVIVSSRGSSMYHPMAPGSIIPPTVSPVHNAPNFLTENRSLIVSSSPSSTPELRPEMIRTSSTPSQHPLHVQSFGFQMGSPPMPAPSHHSSPMLSGSLQGAVPTSQQHNLNTRREVPDPRHTIGRPKSIERR